MVDITTIILAAGQGTRMQSGFPKVLQQLAGRPILEHILATVQQLQTKQISVVVGHQAELIQQTFSNWAINWVMQAKQLGTAHAVLCALATLQPSAQLLILCGDVPLISYNTLLQLCNTTPVDAIGILTAIVADPTGLGRIVRDQAGQICKIVEQKDATAAQLQITEINPGVYLLPVAKLATWLAQINSNNQQQEFYLTDLIAIAAQQHTAINNILVRDQYEIAGINTRVQLAQLERHYQLQQAQRLMLQGVTLLDPARLDLRGNINVGRDITIDVNVILAGTVTIADNVSIGPNVYIKDSVIGAGTVIQANSVIDGAVIGNNCDIGPFARIRPKTILADRAKIGNFVETKNVNLGADSKANHLSYLGDATIGTNVNIGAGCITCNYDGAYKHQTVIADQVFVGSDVQLIAPVTIGVGATIAAGTTVMQDVAPGGLVLNKKQQQQIPSWLRPNKNLIKPEKTEV